jgi:hypothetical protein
MMREVVDRLAGDGVVGLGRIEHGREDLLGQIADHVRLEVAVAHRAVSGDRNHRLIGRAFEQHADLRIAPQAIGFRRIGEAGVGIEGFEILAGEGHERGVDRYAGFAHGRELGDIARPDQMGDIFGYVVEIAHRTAPA